MPSKIFTIILTGIIILLIVGLLGGGLLLYTYKSKGGLDKVESTSKDSFATLSATFYDFSGTPISGGITQALIGGTNKRTHIKFELKVTNTGQVQLLNIRTDSPNANMGSAFANLVTLPTLAIGASGIILGNSAQTCTIKSNCDTNEDCCNPSITDGTACSDSTTGSKQCFIRLDDYSSTNSVTAKNVDFIISLKADYKDATGGTLTVTSSPVTLTYDVRGEKCSDGTSINSCVYSRTGLDSDKPKYCNFVQGSVSPPIPFTAPSIIDKASVCGCPIGQERDGTTENCKILKCSDETPINSCSLATHEGTYGAFMFCKSDKTFQPRCKDCGATNDYYGNPKTGCNPDTLGVQSSAVYRTYSGGLSGSLSE